MTPAPTRTPDPRDALQPGVRQFGWKTDFSKHTVPLDEIAWGGVPPDGIPAITEPQFVPLGVARESLGDEAPVIAVEIDGEARAYPPAILLHHEIVNDVLGGVPVAVTYCPLCNSAVVFDRRVDGREIELHVSGNLRRSDLVMYDTETESWWQQITGEAVVGELAGTVLEVIPSQTISLAEFARAYPDGQVLSPEGESLTNPYFRYDDPAGVPFLFGEPADPRLPAMMYVAVVELGGEKLAVSFSHLAANPVVEEQLGGKPIVILYAPGVRSVLDTRDTREGREVGQIGVFRPTVGGEQIELEAVGDGTFRDRATGSILSITGVALSGPLAGSRLDPVVHGEHFWFAWAAFHPDTRVIG